MRVLFAVGAGLLGYNAITQALAQTARKPGAEWAHVLAPGDGRVTAQLSEIRSGPDADARGRKEADRLARLALRQDPTAVAAVATLGIDAQIRGDTPAARRLLAYSQRLSRRDLRTQLWAIEDAVVRDDFRSALNHYDIALRTSRIAPGLLFPILATAIDDSAIRTALVHTLAKRPVWTQRFLDYVAAEARNPRPVAVLFRDLRNAHVAVSAADDTLLVTALVAKGAFEEAWNYYALARPGVDRSRSRDPRFMADMDRPSPFDWVPINDAGVSTSLQRDKQGGIFEFSVSPGLGGLLLRQLQMLPSGTYAIVGRSAGIDQPESSLPYWQLSCEDGKELGRVQVPNSAQSNGVFTGQVIVPVGCAVQALSLVARSSDSVSGVVGQIEQIQLAPVR